LVSLASRDKTLYSTWQIFNLSFHSTGFPSE